MAEQKDITILTQKNLQELIDKIETQKTISKSNIGCQKDLFSL